MRKIEKGKRKKGKSKGIHRKSKTRETKHSPRQTGERIQHNKVSKKEI
jgi:hypothetical protein